MAQRRNHRSSEPPSERDILSTLQQVVLLQQQQLQQQQARQDNQGDAMQRSLELIAKKGNDPKSGTSQDFSAHHPPTFDGTGDGLDAKNWIAEIEGIFAAANTPDNLKVSVAALKLTKLAQQWWTSEKARLEGEVTWDDFKERFEAKYTPASFRREMVKRFTHLKQGSRPLEEYINEFTALAPYADYTMPEEIDKADKFMEGLQDEIQRYLVSQPLTTFDDIVERSRKQDNYNKVTAARNNWARNRNAPSGRNQNQSQVQGNKRKSNQQREEKDVAAQGDAQRPKYYCEHCKREGHTIDRCRVLKGECLTCGSPDHKYLQCPRKRGRAPNQNRGRLNVLDAEEAGKAEDVVAGKIFVLSIYLVIVDS